MFFQNLLS